MILEGRVAVEQKVAGKSIPKLDESKKYCFLFNDIIVLCNEKDKDNSEHPFVYLNVMATNDISSKKDGDKRLAISSEGTVWSLKFPSGKIRNSWNEALNT